jgi:hypothetical protein
MTKWTEGDLVTGNLSISFEKEKVKSLGNLVFTSQRNTTQKCRLIFENNVTLCV